jgi:hypothetical protein
VLMDMEYKIDGIFIECCRYTNTKRVKPFDLTLNLQEIKA